MTTPSRNRKAEEFLAKVSRTPPDKPVPEPAPSPSGSHPQTPAPQATPPLEREQFPGGWSWLPRANPAGKRLRARLKKKAYEARRLKPHREAVKQELRSRWPLAFPEDEAQVRPWAKGIFHDIYQASIGFNTSQIRITLKDLANTVAYQQALSAGGPRYDLNGKPKGEVSPRERDYARAWLEQLRAKAAQAAPREPAGPVVA